MTDTPTQAPVPDELVRAAERMVAVVIRDGTPDTDIWKTAQSLHKALSLPRRTEADIRADALKELSGDLAGIAGCYGWMATQSYDNDPIPLSDWIEEQSRPFLTPSDDSFGEAIQLEWDDQLKEARAQGAADERERLAKIFAAGRLAEGNSIIHDVPAFIRSQGGKY